MTNQTATHAVSRLNTMLEKHASDRTSMVEMMKKIYRSYTALKDAFTKLTIDHKQARSDLERAKAEIKRLLNDNKALSSDIVMLTSTISLLVESVNETDDVLIDSMRSVVRDLKVEDAPAPATPSESQIDLVATAPQPALRQALHLPEVSFAPVAAAFAASQSESTAMGTPLESIVADVDDVDVPVSDVLSAEEESSIEKMLAEKIDFKI